MSILMRKPAAAGDLPDGTHWSATLSAVYGAAQVPTLELRFAKGEMSFHADRDGVSLSVSTAFLDQFEAALPALREQLQRREATRRQFEAQDAAAAAAEEADRG